VEGCARLAGLRAALLLGHGDQQVQTLCCSLCNALCDHRPPRNFPGRAPWRGGFYPGALFRADSRLVPRSHAGPPRKRTEHRTTWEPPSWDNPAYHARSAQVWLWEMLSVSAVQVHAPWSLVSLQCTSANVLRRLQTDGFTSARSCFVNGVHATSEDGVASIVATGPYTRGFTSSLLAGPMQRHRSLIAQETRVTPNHRRGLSALLSTFRLAKPPSNRARALTMACAQAARIT
jgi:hypothetical protein